METKLCITTVEGMFMRHYNDVLSICSYGKKSILITKDGRNYILGKLLGEIEKILPDFFLRIHRSTIINLMEVQEIPSCDPLKVIMNNKNEYDVAIRKRKILFNKLEQLYQFA